MPLFLKIVQNPSQAYCPFTFKQNKSQIKCSLANFINIWKKANVINSWKKFSSQFYVQLMLLVAGIHHMPLIWVCGPLFYLWSEFLPLLFCCTLSCSFSCQFCSLNLFCYIRSGNYEPMHNPSNELGFCLEVLKELLLALIIIVTNNNNGN